MTIQRVTPRGFVNETTTIQRVSPNGFLNETVVVPPTLTQYFLGTDIAAGGWTPSTGLTLAGVLDEVSPDDTDFIASSTNPSTDVAEIKFLNVQAPSNGNNHTVSYRIKGDSSTNLRVDLVCNTTIIKTWTHNPAPASFTRYDQTLTSGEAATIADYSNLRLRVTAG